MDRGSAETAKKRRSFPRHDTTEATHEPLKLPEDEIELLAARLDVDVGSVGSSSRAPQRERLRARSRTNKFLVHSYLRGGGGVLAEALNLHVDDLFFLYQPLYKFQEEGPEYGTEVLNTKKAMKAIEWLDRAYNCTFEGHEDLVHAPYLWKSHSIRNTYRKKCQEKKVMITHCLEQACSERQLRAVFTVRLGIDHIAELIKMYGEEFRVVVVIRDPRAILSARRRESLGPLLDTSLAFKQQAALLCSSMAADITLAGELMERYPGSVMIIRYEHLLTAPLRVLTYLYNFLGLEATSTHLNKVIRILKLDRSQEVLLQVLKGWQVELTLRESRAVDYGCSHHYDKLGYFPVPKSVTNKDNYFVSWDQARVREDS
ncbi:uncharacterized protein LOC122250059 isoform X2 [Penaeus japonicus]|uniref:uncharacterized protein LOC122250059 isoform X2 n=1 Tax=Penaeus japonicus TaxID=27405 RepID=UPI001C713CB0|nr:uncharacterized protein LOC122250059 isoform X2 [Penaeus japonicus]